MAGWAGAQGVGRALACLALAAACDARPDASRALAAGFRPAAGTGDPGPGFWLEVELADDAWRGASGAWRAADPFAACDLPLAEGAAARVTCGGEALGPEVAAVRAGEVVLAADAPPRGCRLARFVGAGREATSAQPGLGPRWRVALGELASDAIPLWPGGPQEVPLEESGAHRFTCAVSCVAPPPASGEALLRVLLDGAEIARVPQPLSASARPRRLSLDLPASLARGAVLRFEVEGPPCLVVLHTPTISPPAAAPAPRGRRAPDLILVVADTFRADNLAAYGSSERPAPAVDDLAGRGLVFRRAWAPSAWTLPSHASLLRGLHPYEHGAVRPGSMPADDLVGIAERLAAAGYRTAAVTNANFVSRAYGMDRGFEWFQELGGWDTEQTFAAALELLDAADERPTFLFVHSYRTHWPYVAQTAQGAAALDPADAGLLRGMLDAWMRRRDLAGDAAITRRLFDGDWLELLRLLAVERAGGEGPEADAELRGMSAQLRRLYAGAVRDFDAGFGRLVAKLEERRFLERGLLVFTSDHGEAFAEHDMLFHGAGPWEELLRVPLFMAGAGIEPGVSEATASLVDLPRTLAQAAGVAPDPGWSGRSLIGAEGAIPAYAFDCRVRGDPLAVLIDADDKAVMPAASAGGASGSFAGFEHRFDLRVDPAERDDEAGRDPASDAALFERHREELGRILTLRGAPRSRELTALETERLEALGYGGLGDH